MKTKLDSTRIQLFFLLFYFFSCFLRKNHGQNLNSVRLVHLRRRRKVEMEQAPCIGRLNPPPLARMTADISFDPKEPSSNHSAMILERHHQKPSPVQPHGKQWTLECRPRYDVSDSRFAPHRSAFHHQVGSWYCRSKFLMLLTKLSIVLGMCLGDYTIQIERIQIHMEDSLVGIGCPDCKCDWRDFSRRQGHAFENTTGDND